MQFPQEAGQLELDQQRLKALHGDDRKMLALALSMFLDEIIPEFDAMGSLVTAQQWPEFAEQAHKMLPWLGMAGLTSLEHDLRRLEQDAKTAPDPDRLRTGWQAFTTTLDRMKPLLEAELQRARS